MMVAFHKSPVPTREIGNVSLTAASRSTYRYVASLPYNDFEFETVLSMTTIQHRIFRSVGRSFAYSLMAIMVVTSVAQQKARYLDPRTPVEDRIDDLLHRMT